MVFSIVYGHTRSDITLLIVTLEILRFLYHAKFDARAFIADVFNKKKPYEKFSSIYRSSPINVLLPDPIYLCLLQPLESKHFLARSWPRWLTALVVRHYRFLPCP